MLSFFRARRYDGNYFPDATPISWLPEGTPAALSQQMSAVVGDYYYATVLAADASDVVTWNAVYINM